MVAQCELFVFLGVAIFFLVSVQEGRAIQCWECNSHYDPNCADPFKNDTFSLSDCGKRYLQHYPNTPSTVCRKIIQRVKDDYRFIRSCGWLTEEKDGADCIKRAGTFNVLVQYCSCKTDGCNRATSLQISLLTVGVWFTALTLVPLLSVKWPQWLESSPN